MRTLLTALVIPILLSACTPYYYTDAPAVAGRVVERRTGRPVKAARVSMTSGNASESVSADSAGAFSVPALRHWGLLIPGMEGFSPNGTLKVEASGYHPYVEDGIGSPDSLRGGPTVGLGLIEYGRIASDLQHIRVELTPYR